ncbi:MAG: sterol desaturase, partial [Bacteroidota bacterium]
MERWLYTALDILIEYFQFAGIAFVVFYLILKKPMWFRKVQKKLPGWKHYGRDIFYSIFTVSIFAVVAIFVLVKGKEYTNFYDHISEYGVAYYIFGWIWMFFLHDTYFYWMHRLMHHPVLFKHVHLVH